MSSKNEAAQASVVPSGRAPAESAQARSPAEECAQFLGMSDDDEPMARYFIPGGL